MTMEIEKWIVDIKDIGLDKLGFKKYLINKSNYEVDYS